MSAAERIWASRGTYTRDRAYSQQVRKGDVEYVRADLHEAAVHELRRILDVVSDEDRAIIEGVLIDAGEAV